MDMLKKFFPFSFNDKIKDVVSLILTCLIYIVVGAVVGAVLGLLGKLPLIGFVFDLIGTVVGLYVTVTVILLILNYLKVLK